MTHYASNSELDAADIIADLRDAGMIVPTIARHVGVCRGAVNHWIAHTRSPSPYAFKRLRELHTHLTGWEKDPPDVSATA